MTLLQVFQLIENSSFATAIRTSAWIFPVVEAVHLVGLSLIGGAVLLVDLRLLGIVLQRQTVSELARDTHPWLMASLIVMIVTGFALFASESTKCYYSTPFWIKMTSLGLAILFTFTVRRKVVSVEGASDLTRFRGRVVAVISLALWLGVGASGRWIGFSG